MGLIGTIKKGFMAKRQQLREEKELYQQTYREARKKAIKESAEIRAQKITKQAREDAKYKYPLLAKIGKGLKTLRDESQKRQKFESRGFAINSPAQNIKKKTKQKKGGFLDPFQ